MDYIKSAAETARNGLFSYFFSSELPPPPPPPKPFSPDTITLAEIAEARNALTGLSLPLEIADIILDYAEYWIVQRSARKVPLVVSAAIWSATPESSSLYLQTGALGRGEEFDDLPVVKPRKVVFRLNSRDQGWSDSYADHGTYRGAFSWFDATIFREDEEWQGEGERQEPMQALITEGMGGQTQEARDDFPMFFVGRTPDELTPWLARGGFKVVGNGERLTWLLQRNQVACRNFLDHEVEWTENDEEEMGGRNGGQGDGVAGDANVEWIDNGTGSGKMFVSSLKRGDRIGIWARAMYPGWQNSVRSVEVDVYHSIF